MTSINNSKQFNFNLAHLFYAVAMADKKIEVSEKKKIVTIVEKNWITNTANNKEEIYETIRNLISDGISSETAFNQFKNYVKANNTLFTPELSKKIIKSCHSICESFASKNKSELILLAHLHKLLLNTNA